MVAIASRLTPSPKAYNLVRRYALSVSLKIGAHALRDTATSNALDHDPDNVMVPQKRNPTRTGMNCVSLPRVKM